MINKKYLVGILGAFIIILCWFLVSSIGLISKGILPSPIEVVSKFGILLTDYSLLSNIWYTVKLNLCGYLLAVCISLPIGFAIGLIPLLKNLFKNYVEAARYIALPTISGIFISIFGLGFSMKISLLAFGILLFTLPAVIQKIEDLQNPDKDNIYLQTAKTIGMSKWQTIRYVYWPYVIERVYEDLRSLTAISYTYVVIVESLNKTGGIGALISTFTRQSRIAEIYVLIFIIVLIGILQDYLFKLFDPIIFKHHGKEV